MSLLIVIVVIVLFFFFPVDWVDTMKACLASRVSQWKGVIRRKGSKDGKVEIEVDGRKVN
jgi:hypothetical protein